MERYDPLAAPDPQQWLTLDEGERIELVEDYHRRARVRLPDAAAHAAVHAAIENQAALGDETPVRRTLERLITEGLDRHEAIHTVGSVLTDLMHDVMNDAAPDADGDLNPKYFAAVERLTAEGWRSSADAPAETDWEPDRIVEELSVVNEMPVEAILAARERRAAIVPLFLQVIERSLNGESRPVEQDALFWIFHLLGEWREKTAYRPLARLLRLPTDEIRIILFDAITETSNRVMAAVFDRDPQPLYDAILDAKADEFIRAGMCEALAMVTLRNELPRAEAARFLEACYSELQPQEDCYVWVGWQAAIAVLGLVELKPLVAQAFKRGLVDPGVMLFEHFEDDLQRAIEHPGAPRWPSDKEFTLFGDTIKELSGWAPFDPEHADHDDDETGDWDTGWQPNTPAVNPFKDVGRNDPCPCGSGKKFKKCCLESVLSSGELRASSG